MSQAAREIFSHWSFPIWLTVSFVVITVAYIRGWLVIRKTRPAQFSVQRLASFLAGVFVLWLALGSPLDGFADALLSAHMVEHLLLMSVVPPLLLCGLPVVPLLRGLPRFFLIPVVAPLIRVRFLRRFAAWLVTPLVAWMAMNLTFLGWHIPAAYDFALENEAWHAIEHLCFLVSSILFWWCIMQPWPSRAQRQNWVILFYLLAADVVNTMLSAFLAFCGRPVYVFYLRSPNPFHVSLSGDQTLGAAIMWVLGSVAFLVPATLITLRLTGWSPENGDST